MLYHVKSLSITLYTFFLFWQATQRHLLLQHNFTSKTKPLTIAMAPLRGSYKTVADPALSDEQLSELETYFMEFRKQLHCPACNQVTTFHRHGSSTKAPYQPQFKCTSCNKVFKAFEMYPIVCQTSQGSPPAPQLPHAPPTVSTNDVPLVSIDQTALIQQLYTTVEKLTSELNQARLEIQNLHNRINDMTEQIPQVAMTDFPPLPGSSKHTTDFPDAPWHNTAKVQALKHPFNQQREQRRIQRQAAAARFFQPPSENQGFKYLYVPTKARIPVGTLRTTFRKLGINNARLLDVHYPARNIAAILIHNDYGQDFKDLLHHHNVPIKDDFKPFSGTILANPKYAELSSEERDSIVTELQKIRLSRALDHIRPPVKYAVARYFLDQHWIPRSKFDSIIAERYSPKVSAIFAQTHSSQPNHTEEEDFVMDTQEETAMQNLLLSGTDTPVRH